MENLPSRALVILLCALLAACSGPVKVHEARWETRLSGPLPGTASYVADPGYSFLVVDVDLHLGKSAPMASTDFSLVTDTGKSFSAAGLRLPTGDYMMGAITGTGGDMESVALVFTVPDAEKERTFRLKFRDGSPIPVVVKSGGP